MAMRAKDNSEKAARNMAMQVVDWYLDVLLADEGSIAMEGRTVIGALVDFKGQMPQSSGFSGFCKLGAKVDRMRDWPDGHRMAVVVMHKLSDRQREAVCIDRSYRGRTKVAIDPFTPEKPIEKHWGDKECAELSRCTITTFRQRVYDGYSRLEGMLGQHIARAA